MIHNVTGVIEDRLIDLIRLPLESVEGWYGEVFKVEHKGRFYAFKKFKETMHNDISEGKIATYDYDILKDLQDSEYYPKVHIYKENEWMIVDWIEGVPLRKQSNIHSYYDQLKSAYLDSIQSGWFPDDVKGDNILVVGGKVVIIDVGSYLPICNNVEFDVDERVTFLVDHAHLYPSVRDKSPYDYRTCST